MAEERQQLIESSNKITLLSSQLSKPSHPLGFGQNGFHIADLDLTLLVTIHGKHQPEHAKHCAQTQYTQAATVPDQASVKQKLIKRFHELLNQQQPGVVSLGGNDRRGNARNTAAVASTQANKMALRRVQYFQKYGVPCLQQLSYGGITIHRPLKVGDYALILIHDTIFVGKVLFFYSKLTGKNAPHALVTSSTGSTNLSALSNIAVQVFQHIRRTQFSSGPPRVGVTLYPW
ncbi:hypothetical protein Agabi119p4_9229 [Agaricus bisporus var. burnettii]|uniref:Uncharacterized protein n=1 Tax=Agaricus bisporus var. burnettii TaxID=192524 RepID=A0A8H7C629_AGABI|nr:hypothetical protein Agabi119p4_9229 [Agaricus bisporus var. burnettii]